MFLLTDENDVKALQEWRTLIDRAFHTNLAANAKATSSSYRGESPKFAPANATDDDNESYWATDDAVTAAELEIDLGEEHTINYVVLQEYIKLGQRVKSFEIETWKDNAWKKAVGATTIGYKRILKLDQVKTNKIRIRITESKACPLIAKVAVY
jgi:alpha-L-fucosidase